MLRPTERMTFADWCAVPVVLVLMGVPAEAFAQSPVCHPVRRGESAAQIARRVTGDGRNAYQTWFQIKNTSSRFVPKSQYNRIRAGWQACVMTAVRNRTAITQLTAAEDSGPSNVPDLSPALDVSASSSAVAAPDAPAPVLAAAAQPASIHVADRAATSPQSDGSPLVRMIRSVDVTMFLLGAAMVVPCF